MKKEIKKNVSIFAIVVSLLISTIFTIFGNLIKAPSVYAQEQTTEKYYYAFAGGEAFQRGVQDAGGSQVIMGQRDGYYINWLVLDSNSDLDETDSVPADEDNDGILVRSDWESRVPFSYDGEYAKYWYTSYVRSYLNDFDYYWYSVDGPTEITSDYLSQFYIKEIESLFAPTTLLTRGFYSADATTSSGSHDAPVGVSTIIDSDSSITATVPTTEEENNMFNNGYAIIGQEIGDFVVEEVTTDKVFLLDYYDIFNTDYGFLGFTSTQITNAPSLYENFNDDADGYALGPLVRGNASVGSDTYYRNPGTYKNGTGIISASGGSVGINDIDDGITACPALNLNPDVITYAADSNITASLNSWTQFGLSAEATTTPLYYLYIEDPAIKDSSLSSKNLGTVKSVAYNSETDSINVIYNAGTASGLRLTVLLEDGNGNVDYSYTVSAGSADASGLSASSISVPTTIIDGENPYTIKAFLHTNQTSRSSSYKDSNVNFTSEVAVEKPAYLPNAWKDFVEYENSIENLYINGTLPAGYSMLNGGTLVSDSDSSVTISPVSLLHATIDANPVNIYAVENTNATYDVYIVDSANSIAKVYIDDGANLFSDMTALKNIYLDKFDTSNASSMSNMFSNNTGITELNISNFDTSNVTDMSNMFSNISGITELDLSNFNTSNVTNMNNMFLNIAGITELDLSNFDMAKVTSASSMFEGLVNLKVLNMPLNVRRNIPLPSYMYDSRDNNAIPYTSLVQDLFESKEVRVRYAITFNGMGSSDSMTAIYYLHGDNEATLNESTLTKAGYTFAGWKTSADGENIEYSDADTITVNNENVILYAHWNSIGATAVTISKLNTATNQVYGSIDGVISVDTRYLADHTLSYQWYSSVDNAIGNDSLIANEISDSYELPTDLLPGSYYYYCEITSTNIHNGESVVTVSDIITVKIEKIKLTVKIDDKTSIYGEDLEEFSSTILSGSVLEGDVAYTLTSDVNTASQVGKQDIVGVVNDNNYDITFINGSYTITPKDMTLTWADTTKEYNGTYQYPTVTSEDFVADDNDEIIVSSYKDAGTYLATARLSDDIARNYNILNNTQVFTITQITIGLVWGNNALTYNGESQLPEVIYENVLNDDIEEFVIYFSGQEISVGNYVAMATGVSNPNYKLPGNVTCLYEIAPIEVYVRIHDQYATYGDAIKTIDQLTYEIEGAENIVERDKPIFGLSTSAVDGCDAGEYDINIIWEQANYKIHCQAGTYYVSPRAITVEIDSVERVYGEALAELTANITAGELVNGDSLGEICDIRLGVGFYAEVYPVGIYPILLYPNTDNYDISYNYDAEYEITPRPLTISIESKTIVYGEEFVEPAVNIIEGELVEGDIAENVYYCYVATEEYNAGTYAINFVTLNENYDISYNSADYTITPRVLTISVADKSSVYGEDLVELTAEIIDGSIVDGDEFVYNLETPAYAGCPVGEYVIYVNYNNANYVIDDTAGNYTATYTITPKVVTIVWDDNASFTYNGEYQVPTATAQGFGVKVAGAEISAGSYTATATIANVDESNYQINNKTKEFEIVAKNFDLTANTLTIADLTYTGAPLTPMVNVVDSEFGGLTVNKDYIVEYSNNVDAGTVTVTVKGIGNFSGEFTRTFTINKKELVVSWSELTFTYDGLSHKPVATVNDNSLNIIVTGEASEVGVYLAIATLSEEDAQNYRLANATTQFIIEAAQSDDTQTPSTDTDNKEDDDDANNNLIDKIAIALAGVSAIGLIGLTCVVYKKKSAPIKPVSENTAEPEKTSTKKIAKISSEVEDGDEQKTKQAKTRTTNSTAKKTSTKAATSKSTAKKTATKSSKSSTTRAKSSKK